jgi:acyl dehydratase
MDRIENCRRLKKGKKMIELERPADLAQYVGKEIGVSDWFTVGQAIIDKFADATGDHQWIHVDVERAKRDMPGGKTIAHGYLTLSLVPRLGQTIYRVKQRSRGLNYGSNRIRFTGQVPAGSRIRLRQKINSVEPVEGGVRITSENTVEVEGASRPALVAETISMQFD